MTEAAIKGPVVILHGIGMSPLRMAPINLMLRRAGFETYNIGYPSRRFDIESCADNVAAQIKAQHIAEKGPVNLVTHSMGSLVALKLIARDVFPVARSVLIAPPYRGSEVADFLVHRKAYKSFFGPAGLELTTTFRNAQNDPIREGAEVGIIAGTRSYEYLHFRPLMKKAGVHDGLVSVESTRIPGMKDHITLRMSHSFLIERGVSQTVHFLEQGRFKHAPETECSLNIHRGPA